jgi:hypothetical protein
MNCCRLLYRQLPADGRNRNSPCPTFMLEGDYQNFLTRFSSKSLISKVPKHLKTNFNLNLHEYSKTNIKFLNKQPLARVTHIRFLLAMIIESFRKPLCKNVYKN